MNYLKNVHGDEQYSYTNEKFPIITNGVYAKRRDGSAYYPEYNGGVFVLCKHFLSYEPVFIEGNEEITFVNLDYVDSFEDSNGNLYAFYFAKKKTVGKIYLDVMQDIHPRTLHILRDWKGFAGKPFRSDRFYESDWVSATVYERPDGNRFIFLEDKEVPVVFDDWGRLHMYKVVNDDPHYFEMCHKDSGIVYYDKTFKRYYILDTVSTDIVFENVRYQRTAIDEAFIIAIDLDIMLLKDKIEKDADKEEDDDVEEVEAVDEEIEDVEEEAVDKEADVEEVVDKEIEDVEEVVDKEADIEAEEAKEADVEDVVDNEIEEAKEADVEDVVDNEIEEADIETEEAKEADVEDVVDNEIETEEAKETDIKDVVDNEIEEADIENEADKDIDEDETEKADIENEADKDIDKVEGDETDKDIKDETDKVELADIEDIVDIEDETDKDFEVEGDETNTKLQRMILINTEPIWMTTYRPFNVHDPVHIKMYHKDQILFEFAGQDIDLDNKIFCYGFDNHKRQFNCQLEAGRIVFFDFSYRWRTKFRFEFQPGGERFYLTPLNGAEGLNIHPQANYEKSNDGRQIYPRERGHEFCLLDRGYAKDAQGNRYYPKSSTGQIMVLKGHDDRPVFIQPTDARKLTFQKSMDVVYKSYYVYIPRVEEKCVKKKQERNSYVILTTFILIILTFLLINRIFF